MQLDAFVKSEKMTKNTLINLLNEDLSREYAHLHFYLQASACVTGLHREEIGEFLTKQANEELNHVQQFSKLILGLGGFPSVTVAPFKSDLTLPLDILKEALKMEEEVVKNYVERMDQADMLEGEDKVDGRYIHLFLEDQMISSREDVDNLKEMLKNAN